VPEIARAVAAQLAGVVKEPDAPPTFQPRASTTKRIKSQLMRRSRYGFSAPCTLV
jgi:hypothetical protein